MRKALERIRRPITTAQAPDYDEALEKLGEVLFDCVFIDQSFQNGSGLDLTRMVRSMYPQLPVILVIDGKTRAASAEALRLGVSDCMTLQDFQTGILGEIVDRALERHRLLRDLDRLGNEVQELEQELSDKREALTEKNLEVLDLRNELLFRDQELERRGKVLGALHGIADASGRTSDPRERLDNVLAQAMGLVGAEFGLLFIQRGRRFRPESAAGYSRETRNELGDIEGEAAAWLLEESVVRRGPEEGDSRFLRSEEKEGIRSRLTFPSLLGGEVAASMVLASRCYDGFSQRERESLSSCGPSIAAAVHEFVAFERRRGGPEPEGRALEEFLCAISHDLKVPVVSICGFADLLQEDFGERLESEGKHCLTRIKENAQKLLLLITDLLSFYELDTNAREPEVCDMSRIVGEAVEALEFEIHEARCRVILPGRMPAVACHPNQMYRLWSNILSNSLRNRHVERAPEVEVGFREEEERLVFWVRDNGSGIPASRRAKVFESVERLRRVSSSSGTGMGLAIARRIVLSHGGDMWIESEEGVGTTVYFSLPRGSVAGDGSSCRGEVLLAVETDAVRLG